MLKKATDKMTATALLDEEALYNAGEQAIMSYLVSL